MSQENVKVARAVFEAWNAGDMDAVRELQNLISSCGCRRAGRSLGLS